MPSLPHRAEASRRRLTAPSTALLACGAILGCEGSKATTGSAPGSASAATTASAPATTASAPVEAPPPPDDLDIAAQQKALKCAADAKSGGACGVLAAMKSCTAWGVIAPSGEGRWLGRGFVVDAGKSTDTFIVVRSKRVPLAEVGPGQVPAKVGIAEIPKDDKNAFEQADRAIRAFERGDVPSKANPAIEFTAKLAEWPDAYVTKTRGGHAYVITHGGAFACLGPKQQLYFVRRAATRGGAGDGLYAEAWGTSW